MGESEFKIFNVKTNTWRTETLGQIGPQIWSIVPNDMKTSLPKVDPTWEFLSKIDIIGSLCGHFDRFYRKISQNWFNCAGFISSMDIPLV